MVTVLSFVVTPFMQNARVLYADGSPGCWVVDPGGEVDRLLAALRERSLKVEMIVLTHAHIDHGGGVQRLRELLTRDQGSAPPLASCGAEEAFMRSSLSQQALLFGLSPKEYENVPEPDQVLEDGSELLLGKVPVRALFTPGHSPGHLSFFIESTPFDSAWVTAEGREEDRTQGHSPLLIAGDALFAGSIGRTDLPGGDHQVLLRSIAEKKYYFARRHARAVGAWA